ncbi:MAG TPA: hemerythrin domain-containing protein [Acidimicrobiales bacterium]|jgi:hemerythrin-like domain-containing protein|nr:hemerythrin domain-containing protein [Acidimicrobiales bacterium]
MALPTLLAPLDEVRRRLVAVLDLLADTSEPETRADLAGELVQLSARYEDAKERALYPVLRKLPGSEAPMGRAEADQAAVRSAMVEMRNRTKHVKPINAHADDPEGFEESLDALIDAIHGHLDQEDRELLPLVERLDPAEQRELARNLERAVANASSHPDPPHNPIGRAMANLGEKIDRRVNDTSTTWHPGVQQLPDEDPDRPGES